MPGYRTKQERIAIAGVDDLVIRSLLDRRQFFDPLGEADCLGISSASWPLFGVLWPSGAQLAARIALRPVCAGERILEVGCGLALASLVGHRRGADVTASDRHPLAERFLEENLRLNDLAPMKYRHGHWSVPERPPGRRRVPALRIVRGQYDLVIGSDLLYEPDESAALAGFIARHASPGRRGVDRRPGPRQPAYLQPADGGRGFSGARGGTARAAGLDRCRPLQGALAGLPPGIGNGRAGVAHHELRSSRSFRNTVRGSGCSGSSGKASRSLAMTVGLVRRKNVLISRSTSSVET